MRNEYNTKQRNKIAEFLKKHKEKSLTAKDIFEKLNAGGEDVDKSTVYRNLERLCNEGKLVKYKESGSNSTYYRLSDDNGECQHHMHAQCADCGKIFHLEEEFVEDFEKKMELVYGIGVDASRTLIVGECDDCRKKKKKR